MDSRGGIQDTGRVAMHRLSVLYLQSYEVTSVCRCAAPDLVTVSPLCQYE